MKHLNRTCWQHSKFQLSLKIGVDIVIESLTKYFSGHSDNFLGLIALNSTQLAKAIKTTSVRLGDFVSSESCFQAAKGLKTLKLRIERHSENADKVFIYLKTKKLSINKSNARAARNQQSVLTFDQRQ